MHPTRQHFDQNPSCYWELVAMSATQTCTMGKKRQPYISQHMPVPGSHPFWATAACPLTVPLCSCVFIRQPETGQALFWCVVVVDSCLIRQRCVLLLSHAGLLCEDWTVIVTLHMWHFWAADTWTMLTTLVYN